MDYLVFGVTREKRIIHLGNIRAKTVYEAKNTSKRLKYNNLLEITSTFLVNNQDVIRV